MSTITPTDESSATRFAVVTANRILAHEGILDAYGHVSARVPGRPDRFLLSRARAPEIVADDDLMEFDLAGDADPADTRVSYIERFIHAAIYQRRPDVQAICHNHTPSALPFSVSLDTRLEPVIHQAGFLGEQVPVWDIADEFGSETDLLVRNLAQADSLATALGDGCVALMRGHGCIVTADVIPDVVSRAIFMDKNARVVLDAARLGAYRPLARGEITQRAPTGGSDGRVLGSDRRDWDLWLLRAGLTPPS